MRFYRWPCGDFESLGPPWQVYAYRPQPCTPAGDLVGEWPTREAADQAAASMNARSLTVDQARAEAAKR